MTILKTILSIIRNKREPSFNSIIRRASEEGYEIIGVAQAFDKIRNGTLGDKALILRHDVDHVSPATKEMAEVENYYGASSTFYFRWSTFDLSLIRYFNELGHECSLHYETLADYYKKHGINPKKVKPLRTILEECQSLLRKEIDRFKECCHKDGVNIDLHSIAAHGDRVNRILGVPNNRLVEQAPKGMFSDLDEAYDETLLNKLDIYISDSPTWKCAGFKYGVNPLEAIDQGKNRILFLTHPEHWGYTFYQKVYQIGRLCLRGVQKEPAVFKK